MVELSLTVTAEGFNVDLRTTLHGTLVDLVQVIVEVEVNLLVTVCR